MHLHGFVAGTCGSTRSTLHRYHMRRSALQAKLLPSVPAHAASFLGDRICLSAALNGAKVSITTHSNAYVGDLRQQVSHDLLFTPVDRLSSQMH